MMNASATDSYRSSSSSTMVARAKASEDEVDDGEFKPYDEEPEQRQDADGDYTYESYALDPEGDLADERMGAEEYEQEYRVEGEAFEEDYDEERTASFLLRDSDDLDDSDSDEEEDIHMFQGRRLSTVEESDGETSSGATSSRRRPQSRSVGTSAVDAPSSTFRSSTAVSSREMRRIEACTTLSSKSSRRIEASTTLSSKSSRRIEPGTTFSSKSSRRSGSTMSSKETRQVEASTTISSKESRHREVSTSLPSKSPSSSSSSEKPASRTSSHGSQGSKASKGAEPILRRTPFRSKSASASFSKPIHSPGDEIARPQRATWSSPRSHSGGIRSMSLASRRSGGESTLESRTENAIGEDMTTLYDRPKSSRRDPSVASFSSSLTENDEGFDQLMGQSFDASLDTNTFSKVLGSKGQKASKSSSSSSNRIARDGRRSRDPIIPPSPAVRRPQPRSQPTTVVAGGTTIASPLTEASEPLGRGRRRYPDSVLSELTTGTDYQFGDDEEEEEGIDENISRAIDRIEGGRRSSFHGRTEQYRRPDRTSRSTSPHRRRAKAFRKGVLGRFSFGKSTKEGSQEMEVPVRPKTEPPRENLLVSRDEFLAQARRRSEEYHRPQFDEDDDWQRTKESGRRQRASFQNDVVDRKSRRSKELAQTKPKREIYREEMEEPGPKHRRSKESQRDGHFEKISSKKDQGDSFNKSQRKPLLSPNDRRSFEKSASKNKWRGSLEKPMSKTERARLASLSDIRPLSPLSDDESEFSSANNGGGERYALPLSTGQASVFDSVSEVEVVDTLPTSSEAVRDDAKSSVSSLPTHASSARRVRVSLTSSSSLESALSSSVSSFPGVSEHSSAKKKSDLPSSKLHSEASSVSSERLRQPLIPPPLIPPVPPPRVKSTSSRSLSPTKKVIKHLFRWGKSPKSKNKTSSSALSPISTSSANSSTGFKVPLRVQAEEESEHHTAIASDVGQEIQYTASQGLVVHSAATSPTKHKTLIGRLRSPKKHHQQQLPQTEQFHFEDLSNAPRYLKAKTPNLSSPPSEKKAGKKKIDGKVPSRHEGKQEEISRDRPSDVDSRTAATEKVSLDTDTIQSRSTYSQSSSLRVSSDARPISPSTPRKKRRSSSPKKKIMKLFRHKSPSSAKYQKQQANEQPEVSIDDSSLPTVGDRSQSSNHPAPATDEGSRSASLHKESKSEAASIERKKRNGSQNPLEVEEPKSENIPLPQQSSRMKIFSGGAAAAEGIASLFGLGSAPVPTVDSSNLPSDRAEVENNGQTPSKRGKDEKPSRPSDKYLMPKANGSTLGDSPGPVNTTVEAKSSKSAEDLDTTFVQTSIGNDGGMTKDGKTIMPGIKNLLANNCQPMQISSPQSDVLEKDAPHSPLSDNSSLNTDIATAASPKIGLAQLRTSHELLAQSAVSPSAKHDQQMDYAACGALGNYFEKPTAPEVPVKQVIESEEGRKEVRFSEDLVFVREIPALDVSTTDTAESRRSRDDEADVHDEKEEQLPKPSSSGKKGIFSWFRKDSKFKSSKTIKADLDESDGSIIDRSSSSTSSRSDEDVENRPPVPVPLRPGQPLPLPSRHKSKFQLALADSDYESTIESEGESDSSYGRSSKESSVSGPLVLDNDTQSLTEGIELIARRLKSGKDAILIAKTGGNPRFEIPTRVTKATVIDKESEPRPPLGEHKLQKGSQQMKKSTKSAKRNNSSSKPPPPQKDSKPLRPATPVKSAKDRIYRPPLKKKPTPGSVQTSSDASSVASSTKDSAVASAAAPAVASASNKFSPHTSSDTVKSPVSRRQAAKRPATNSFASSSGKVSASMGSTTAGSTTAAHSQAASTVTHAEESDVRPQQLLEGTAKPNRPVADKPTDAPMKSNGSDWFKWLMPWNHVANPSAKSGDAPSSKSANSLGLDSSSIDAGSSSTGGLTEVDDEAWREILNATETLTSRFKEQQLYGDLDEEGSEARSISDDTINEVNDAIAKFKEHAERLGMDERELMAAVQDDDKSTILSRNDTMTSFDTPRTSRDFVSRMGSATDRFVDMFEYFFSPLEIQQ